MSLQQAPAVLAQVVSQNQGLSRLHLAEHFDGIANVFHLEGEVMRGLPLGAALLQNDKGLEEDGRLGPDHVDDLVDHLLLLVGQLVEAEGRQVQLVVRLEDIVEARQRVHDMEVTAV